MEELNIAEIMRPQKIDVNDEQLNVEFFCPRPIYNDKDELIDILIISVLIVSDKNEETGKYNLPIDVRNLDEARYKEYNGYTYGLGKLIRLSEIINDKLQSVIDLYLVDNDIDAIINRNSDCKKRTSLKDIELTEFTFENLRGLLSCIIKTDTEIQKIDLLNSNDKRKKLSKILHGYIEDRDKYVHGKLFFLYPNYTPVLRVKNKTEQYYIKYEKGVFTSSLQTFQYLFNVLSVLQQELQS